MRNQPPPNPPPPPSDPAAHRPSPDHQPGDGPEPSARAFQLLEAALTVPAAERAEFLERACADSAELRVEVETLLKAIEQVEDIFSAQTVPPSEAPTTPEPGDSPGQDPGRPSSLLGTMGAGAAVGATQLSGTPGESGPGGAGSYIGVFRLLSILGEGGFGVVFLGERRRPMVQRVAIKVIKPGMDSGKVIARFEQERQVLAMMDHPAIAKVFDAGQTSTGRPYFVMEYVKGEPINRYCDRNRLTLRARLELFIGVCEAVQHAHNRGVIHRDLKPSNVLVGVVDDKPQPKVIDFGVAKAITHIAAASEVFTQQGMFIGTPEYMSPEQAEMGPTDIDTRSDVFSLGVMLYELLTGALPIDGKTLRRAGLVEIQRIIREADRPRPSTRLSDLNESSAGSGDVAATARKTDLDHLSRELRRELDWIPLKALRTDRTERYRSAAELADDIRNYLEGRAVVARPPSRLYSARKFVRKNRGVVGAVAAVMMALAAGGGVAGWKWREAVRARDAEAAARRETETQRASVTELLVFMGSDLLPAPDPIHAVERPLDIPTEALDRAAAALSNRFTGNPDLNIRLGAMLGRAYSLAGLPVKSVELLTRTQEMIDTTPYSDDSSVEQVAVDLARALMRLGEAGRAVRTVQSALDKHSAAGGGVPRADAMQGNLLNELGNALKWCDRFDEADVAYDQSLAVRTACLPPDHPDLIGVRTNKLLSRMNRLKKESANAKAAGDGAGVDLAESSLRNVAEDFKRAAADSERILGAGHAETRVLRTEVAGLLTRFGKYDDAVAAFAEVVQEQRRPRDWRDAETTARYGNALLMSGKNDRARDQLVDALRAYRTMKGKGNSDTVKVAIWLAQALEKLGDVGKAADVLKDQYGDAVNGDGGAKVLRQIAEKLSALLERAGLEDQANEWKERARSTAP